MRCDNEPNKRLKGNIYGVIVRHAFCDNSDENKAFE